MESGVGGVDKEVIHVYDKPSFGNHVAERVVHESLEGSRGVGEPKEHHCGFEESFVGDKGCLPLVPVFDPYIVVSPANVKLDEDLGVSQFVYKIGDKGKGVGIMNGVFVDVSVVLTRAESPIFLFNEKER